jgi:hypothetical protein
VYVVVCVLGRLLGVLLPLVLLLLAGPVVKASPCLFKLIQNFLAQDTHMHVVFAVVGVVVVAVCLCAIPVGPATVDTG